MERCLKKTSRADLTVGFHQGLKGDVALLRPRLIYFGYGVDEFEFTELYARFIGHALFDDIVEALSEIVGPNEVHVLDGLIE